MKHRAADAGFSLVEILVSIGVIGVVMTALTGFFVRAVSVTSQQRGVQTAVQLADDAVERVRSIKGSAIVSGRDKKTTDEQWASPVTGVAAYLADMQKTWDSTAAADAGASAPLPTTAQTVTLGGVPYAQNWYIGKCWQPLLGGDCTATLTAGFVQLYRVVVAVSWSERNCTSAACSYVTSTLVSGVASEAVFNANATAQPPAVNNPGGQLGEVTAPVALNLSAAGGAPPLTWSAIGLPPGLAMSSGGVVTGAPTLAGTYAVIANATDGFGLVGSAAFTWTVNPVPKLTSPGNQVTVIGDPAVLPIALSGGTGPFTWSVVKPGGWGATGLPPGLSIDAATGVITGTTTSSGAAKDVTVTVADAFGVSGSTTFTWRVLTRPTITVPATTRTDAYGTVLSVQATATGGTGPYTWSATNLPAGLSMTPTGLIAGTLSAGTRYLTTITLVDSLGSSNSMTVDWNVTTVSELKVTGLSGDRTGDTVGKVISLNPNSSGGTGAVTWTATGLPPGITLNGSTGKLTGTLTTAGTYTVKLTAKDSVNKTAVYMFTWAVS